MIIYKIINLVNNKIYIGKTIKSLNIRWVQHLKHAEKKINTNFYNAINKYGKENFKIELVEDVSDVNDKKYLSFSESYWILYYRSNEREFGYNIKIDSEGGDTRTNNPNRDEICKKTSGENHWMYNKSLHSIWIEKYGVEEANKKENERIKSRI